MHILIGFGRDEFAGVHPTQQLVESRMHSRQLVIGEQSRMVEDLRVGLGTGDVVLRQAPVEVRGLAQRGQRIGRTVGESSAPQAQSFAHRSSFPTSTDAPARSLK